MFPTPEVRSVHYEKVYEPSEDSFLLLDCFEEEKPYLSTKFTDKTSSPVVVEIGTGSGIVTTFIQQNILPQGIYIATDVNPHACRAVLDTAKVNAAHSIDTCQMSLTSAIRGNSVDVLVFNPPYVPADDVPAIPTTEDDETWLDLALCGGPEGMDVTWKVLDELDSTLSQQGAAYILFCARNKPDEVQEKMRARGWVVTEVLKRKAGWEVLSILRITRQ
ncbi:eRF1 methyltransferase catalytic subunit Mtq2p [[Candida] anglica]|uniref:ERF1 methyltransferase catalytic subunit Mtq2p n=1 Tax=[Candida] anglica TaxID=148631 RepID=A0ABP0EH14_9ASCO